MRRAQPCKPPATANRLSRPRRLAAILAALVAVAGASLAAAPIATATPTDVPVTIATTTPRAAHAIRTEVRSSHASPSSRVSSSPDRFAVPSVAARRRASAGGRSRGTQSCLRSEPRPTVSRVPSSKRNSGSFTTSCRSATITPTSPSRSPSAWASGPTTESTAYGSGDRNCGKGHPDTPLSPERSAGGSITGSSPVARTGRTTPRWSTGACSQPVRGSAAPVRESMAPFAAFAGT
jgi:hypothetical protein